MRVLGPSLLLLLLTTSISGCLTNPFGPQGPEYQFTHPIDQVPEGLAAHDPHDPVAPVGHWILEAHLDGWLWYAQRIGPGEHLAERPSWGMEFFPDEDAEAATQPLLVLTDPVIDRTFRSVYSIDPKLRHDPFDRDIVQHAQGMLVVSDRNDAERFLFGYIASNVPGTVRLYLDLGGDTWNRIAPLGEGSDPLEVTAHTLAPDRPIRIENETVPDGLAAFVVGEAQHLAPAQRSFRIGYDEPWHERQRGEMEEYTSSNYWGAFGWLDYPAGPFRLQMDYAGPEERQEVWVVTQANSVDDGFESLFGYNFTATVQAPPADGDLPDSRPR